MKTCGNCLATLKNKVKANDYCTITRSDNAGILDCYLCDECVVFMKQHDRLIKIFDPNEKPLTYPIK